MVCDKGVRVHGQGMVMRRYKENLPEAAAGMKTRMIRMLKRALSICLLLVLAAWAMVLAWRLGQRPDPRVVRFLNSPSVVENFARRASASKADETEEAKSPLVAQAEAFAFYLNPPELPRRTPPPARARVMRAEAAPVAAVSVSPKFRVVGISYHRSNPAESKALVWEPGGGLNWVAEGAKLGRMLVRQINRGSILYQDAVEIHEMTIELDATSTMPAQKPQDRLLPEDGSKIAVSIPKEDLRIQEEPTLVMEADANKPRIEGSSVPTDAKPEHEPTPAHPTPGRRPRPMRPVARQG